MASEALGNIIFILLVVLANGFFVAAEFAIVKVRRTQLETRLRAGQRRASVAHHIVNHLDAYLSATQLGITLTSLGLGWIGEPLLADMLGRFLGLTAIFGTQTIHAISFIVSFAMLTYLQIILGELAPRYVALRYPEQAALVLAYPLQLFFRVFRPFIWFLSKSSNVLLHAFGVELVAATELVHSPEELEVIVSEGAKTGVFNKTEQELISKIFEFSNTSARDIMVPRTEVIAVPESISRERLVRLVTEEGYSRLPVFRDSLDNIVGIIYTKDLISMLEHRDLIVLQDIIRPAYLVPGAIKISQLMRELQERKIAMAIVIDEFGGTQGIITMEDILEEIVGEIHDEYDEVLKDIEQSSDGSALVNARIDIREFNEKFAARIPEDQEFETLNGFLTKLTGRIPELHDEIVYENLRFIVMKRSQRRVRQIKVFRTEPLQTLDA